MFENLAYSIGVPEDQLRMIILILAGYPISLFNYFLSNPKLRLWYGLLTGFLLQFLMYEWECYHIIIATAALYIFNRFFNRKYSPFWILILTVAHLSFLHIKRMIFNWGGWSLDVSTIYMMSICKFSAMAFSYEDGGKPDANIKSSYHRKQKIVEMPTLLETFSYIFYFPSAVVGPSFEFSDFREFIHLEGPFKSIPKAIAVWSAFVELGKSVINLSLYFFLSQIFDCYYCATEEFGQKSFIYKFFYFNMAEFIQKTKYYGGWKMAQSVVVLSGLGYNPIPAKDQSEPNSEGQIVHKFNRIENCVIRDVEFESNPKRRIQFWNRTVHLWLKYNVFMRLLNVETRPFHNNKGLASLITFMVSAFWHGFYPVYYLVFFLFYLLEQVCGYLEEEYDLFKIMDKQNILIKYAFSYITMSFCNYLGLSFALLSMERAVMFNLNLYCFNIIGTLALFFYLRYKRLQRKKKEGREKREREMMKTTPKQD